MRRQALASLVHADLRAMAARRLAGNARMPLRTTELVIPTVERDLRFARARLRDRLA